MYYHCLGDVMGYGMGWDILLVLVSLRKFKGKSRHKVWDLKICLFPRFHHIWYPLVTVLDCTLPTVYTVYPIPPSAISLFFLHAFFWSTPTWTDPNWTTPNWTTPNGTTPIWTEGSTGLTPIGLPPIGLFSNWTTPIGLTPQLD